MSFSQTDKLLSDEFLGDGRTLLQIKLAAAEYQLAEVSGDEEARRVAWHRLRKLMRSHRTWRRNQPMVHREQPQ